MCEFFQVPLPKKYVAFNRDAYFCQVVVLQQFHIKGAMKPHAIQHMHVIHYYGSNDTHTHFFHSTRYPSLLGNSTTDVRTLHDISTCKLGVPDGSVVEMSTSGT